MKAPSKISGPRRWYLCIESAENWRADLQTNFTFLGVAARYEHRLRRDLKPGDRLITYITKAYAFADVREVTEGLTRLRCDTGYAEGYPFKIGTRRIIANDPSTWVDVKQHLEALDLTRGRGRWWRMVVRQTFRALSSEDGAYIQAQIEAAAARYASGSASAA